MYTYVYVCIQFNQHYLSIREMIESEAHKCSYIQGHICHMYIYAGSLRKEQGPVS
jgi:hypothetical protein